MPDLRAAAEQLMRDNGLAVEIPPPVLRQAEDLKSRTAVAASDVRDLRDLYWSSIDNFTSRDLDQLEVAESLPDGSTKMRVAVADVDAFVDKGSVIDRFAADQTTTVYAGVWNFSMLPEALSTGATSLLEGTDKLAIVVEFVVTTGGHLQSTDVYRALVTNHAQLAYDTVGPWLDGRGAPPPKVQASPELQRQLNLQNRAATALRKERYRHGALNIQTIENRPIFRNQRVVSLETEDKNSATTLIEDFMIAANEIVARLLEDHGLSFIERVVARPARWDRIVALAEGLGAHLPQEPDSKALNDFL